MLAAQKEVRLASSLALPRLSSDLCDRRLTSRHLQVILSKIRVLSQSHIVHPGLDFFRTAPAGSTIDPSLVPGLKESGWTPEMDEL